MICIIEKLHEYKFIQKLQNVGYSIDCEALAQDFQG